MIIIGRPIGGISINPLEYVVDANNEVMTFPDMKAAHSFLIEHGVPENELEFFVFEEVAV